MNFVIVVRVYGGYFDSDDCATTLSVGLQRQKTTHRLSHSEVLCSGKVVSWLDLTLVNVCE